jgi:hypothetical protein
LKPSPETQIAAGGLEPALDGFEVRLPMRLLGSVADGTISDLPVYQAFRDHSRLRGWGSFGDVCLRSVYN